MLWSMDTMGSLLALTARQHDAVGRRQAIALGMSPSTVDRAFRQQGWPDLHPGVRGAPGSQDTALRAVSAALLAAHPGAAASGRTGLWLRGLLEDPPSSPVIVTPMSGNVPRTLCGVRLIPSRTLRPQDVSIVRRLPAAFPARCFVDLCATPAPCLADVVDDLLTVLQKRGVSIAQLNEQLKVAAGYPGLSVLTRAVGDVSRTGADSPFTRRVHERLVREGFDPDPFPEPLPTAQALLHPDISFFKRRGRKATVECDGLAFHGSHLAQAKDTRKDRAYRSVGCENRRIGWWEFHNNWNEFAADLSAAIDRAPRS
ncbi:MAG: hypothetical protein ACI867_000771 [Glaciecola sp.]|jgi:hypothetical protein